MLRPVDMDWEQMDGQERLANGKSRDRPRRGPASGFIGETPGSDQKPGWGREDRYAWRLMPPWAPEEWRETAPHDLAVVSIIVSVKSHTN